MRPHRDHRPRPGDRRRHAGRAATARRRRRAATWRRCSSPSPGARCGTDARHGARRHRAQGPAAVLLRPPRASIMGFAAPIAIASFFGFIFSGGSGRRGGARAGRRGGRGRQRDLQGDRRRRCRRTGPRRSRGTATRRARRAQRASHVAVVIPRASATPPARPSSAGARGRSSSALRPVARDERRMVRGILTQHVMQAVSARCSAATRGGSCSTIRWPASTRADADRAAHAAVNATTSGAPAHRPGAPAPAAGSTMPYDRESDDRAGGDAPTTASRTRSPAWACSSCSSPHRSRRRAFCSSASSGCGSACAARPSRGCGCWRPRRPAARSSRCCRWA